MYSVGFRELDSEHQLRRDLNRSMLLPNNTHGSITGCEQDMTLDQGFLSLSRAQMTIDNVTSQSVLFSVFPALNVNGTIHRPGGGANGLGRGNGESQEHWHFLSLTGIWGTLETFVGYLFLIPLPISLQRPLVSFQQTVLSLRASK